jgi:metal-responsive CopG/Arc/MetJ family transcriptional regulator
MSDTSTVLSAPPGSGLEPLNIRVPGELLERLDELAARRGAASRSSVARQALAAGLELIGGAR